MTFPVSQPTDYSKAYGSRTPLSTKIAAQKWRLVVAALLAVLLAIVLVAALVLAGIGDPLRGWQPTHTPQLIAASSVELQATHVLRFDTLPAPPFMLEISAQPANGAPWGIWLQAAPDQPSIFLINPAQRSLTALTADDWQPFIHITPESNTLLVHILTDGKLEWRMNGEIAWSGQLSKPITTAGLILPTSVQAFEVEVRFYTPTGH